MEMPDKKSALLFLAKRGGDSPGAGDSGGDKEDAAKEDTMVPLVAKSLASAVKSGDEAKLEKAFTTLIRFLKS